MKRAPGGRANKKTMTISVRLPLEVALELKELARRSYEKNMAQTISSLLHAGGGLSGLGTADEGYNAGLRTGLHEAKEAIRDALKAKWH